MTTSNSSSLTINNNYDGKVEKESFFHLVRKYDWHLKFQSQQQEKQHVRIGEDGPPVKEQLKFKSIKSFGYSLNNVKKIPSESDDSVDKYEFLVGFIGLLGSSGVLPQHYSKLALERIKQGDHALVDFLGMFEHRLISFYYKAWSKYKLALSFENADSLYEDNFSTVIKSLAGFSNGPLTQLYYSGHFARNNRSLSNLVLLLKEMTQSDVSVDSLVGQWLPIHEDDRCMQGKRGRNHKLGEGVLLGKRYWDIQSKIVIVIHDIDMKKFDTLRTGRPFFELLRATVNAYVPVHINIYLKLLIKCNRNENQPLGHKLQLSENFWLASKKKNNLISTRRLKRS